MLSKKSTSGFLCMGFMSLTCLAIIFSGPNLLSRLNSSGDYHGGWEPSNPVSDGGVSPKFYPDEWRGKGEDKTRLLYQDYEAVHGEPYTPRRQAQSPSCVGQAVAAAVDILACVDIHTHQDAERAPPAPIAASVVYGMSRQEIGGLGPKVSGGSYNWWGARAVVEYGAVARLWYPGLDLREYTTELAYEYGKYGVPTRVENIAKRHPVYGYIRIKSYKDLRDAINAGCPIIIGSKQGFGKGKLKRDADGFLNPPARLFRPSVWRHSMACIAMCDEGRKGALILNSWGDDWISGPKRFGDEPAGSFWVDASIINSMVKQGDSWALIGFQGWRSIKVWSPR